VRATGVARTDYFFDEDNRRASFDKLYKNYPEAKGRKVLLYAPTYRGDADRAQPPKMFDIEKMVKAIGDGAVLLIKQHGFVSEKTAIPASCRDRAFDVSGSMRIEELLFVSDAVITDYSSLIFEYSLFLRPMVFYAYDLDEFYDYRGFYYKYDNDFLPGRIVRTEEGLREACVTALRGVGAAEREQIKRFRDRFMGACDGHSAERIADYITRKK
jgi:CDP-ribitol ribitolphosphotransferase